MNGLYIHVPFCQKRCIYCDFYSTTCGEAERKNYVESVCREMVLRANYLPNKSIQTIYLGGGTPSQLSISELNRLFETIYQTFQIDSDAEITMEVNPDDLSSAYVAGLRELPIHRISMGIQTFNDELLHFLHRRHTAKQAISAINLLHSNGFDNISIDLIYGLPRQTLENWSHDLDCGFNLPGVRHLSAYALSYEENTPLWLMRQNHTVAEVNEEVSLSMYRLLMAKASNAGFEHYEISNFAQPSYQSRHNSGYWHSMLYLGLGPAAHSFNGKSRQWNLADLYQYLQAQGDVLHSHLYRCEELDRRMLFNETILKSMRTKDGLELEEIEKQFGPQQLKRLKDIAQPYLRSHQLILEGPNKKLRLTEEGIFVSDGIMSDFMLTD